MYIDRSLEPIVGSYLRWQFFQLCPRQSEFVEKLCHAYYDKKLKKYTRHVHFVCVGVFIHTLTCVQFIRKILHVNSRYDYECNDSYEKEQSIGTLMKIPVARDFTTFERNYEDHYPTLPKVSSYSSISNFFSFFFLSSGDHHIFSYDAMRRKEIGMHFVESINRNFVCAPKNSFMIIDPFA